jgi:hypothetical protein
MISADTIGDENSGQETGDEKGRKPGLASCRSEFVTTNAT